MSAINFGFLLKKQLFL